MCPEAFAAQLPEGWAGSGRTLGELDLMSIDGLQVLLVDPYSEWHQVFTIDRAQQLTAAYESKLTGDRRSQGPAGGGPEPIAIPLASTVLRAGDWIYFGVNKSGPSTDAVQAVISERLGLTDLVIHIDSLARSPQRKTFIQFLPEFDLVPFPPHCVNGILGRPEDARPGQNALNIRKAFGINVAGIVRASGEVSWWPGASESAGGLVGKGDSALIMRMPQWGRGATAQVADRVNHLLDLASFQARLGFESDPAAWRRWQLNMAA